MSLRKLAARPRPIGRPPAGARQGERVKDYPQLSVRVPPEMKARLVAISVVRSQPQWRVLSASIMSYFRELSADEQRLIDGLIRTSGRVRPRSRRRLQP